MGEWANGRNGHGSNPAVFILEWDTGRWASRRLLRKMNRGTGEQEGMDIVCGEKRGTGTEKDRSQSPFLRHLGWKNGDWLPESTTAAAGPVYLRVPVPVFSSTDD